MILRRAGLGLLVGAVLIASSGASAGPALVFEPYNGTVFYAEDPDAQWFPASLTKLMTAYVTFQALKAGTVTPDTKLICSKEATEQAPSKLWLKVGESITLDVALKVLIVESANDVAVMIAEGVAGSQEVFVQRMNEAAQHLGMTRTNFANVNGLPDERQVTTARDLARLSRAIIIAFPEHADLFTTVQVKVGKQIMRTHNGLLVSLPGADGMKTGFICNSGFNVVASATRDGRKLVAVVLGEQSLATRRVRATDLLENGFKRYFWKCQSPRLRAPDCEFAHPKPVSAGVTPTKAITTIRIVVMATAGACPTLRPVTVVVVDGSITALKPPAAVTGGTATTCALADSIDPNG